jgi:hypothetical protein
MSRKANDLHALTAMPRAVKMSGYPAHVSDTGFVVWRYLKNDHG